MPKQQTDGPKVTPHDAQKGGQGALSQAHPEIPLNQAAPRTDESLNQGAEVTDGLTASQIQLMCEIEERDPSALTDDRKKDLERLLSEGYVAPLQPGSRMQLTAKGANFLSARGASLNEA